MRGQRARQRWWPADTVGGWHLRALFANAMLFGGCIMASTPLITGYLLRDLRFSPMQYGLALGRNHPGRCAEAGSATRVRHSRRVSGGR